MRIFVVELCRQYRDNVVMECANIHFSSSEDRAFRWASRNVSFLNEDGTDALFFTISSSALDGDALTDTEYLGWVGRDGQISRDEIPEYVQEALAEAGADL
jgi:hypothetical protein